MTAMFAAVCNKTLRHAAYTSAKNEQTNE